MPRRYRIALIVIGFVVVVGGILLLTGVILGDDTGTGVDPTNENVVLVPLVSAA